MNALLHNPAHVHYCNHCGSTLFCMADCRTEAYAHAAGLPLGEVLTCDSCDERLWVRAEVRDLAKAVEVLIRGNEDEYKRLTRLPTAKLLNRLQTAQGEVEGACVDLRSSLEDLVDDHPQVAHDRAALVISVVKFLRDSLLVLDLEGERRKAKGNIVDALNERTE